MFKGKSNHKFIIFRVRYQQIRYMMIHHFLSSDSFDLTLSSAHQLALHSVDLQSWRLELRIHSSTFKHARMTLPFFAWWLPSFHRLISIPLHCHHSLLLQSIFHSRMRKDFSWDSVMRPSTAVQLTSWNEAITESAAQQFALLSSSSTMRISSAEWIMSRERTDARAMSVIHLLCNIVARIYWWASWRCIRSVSWHLQLQQIRRLRWD